MLKQIMMRLYAVIRVWESVEEETESFAARVNSCEFAVPGLVKKVEIRSRIATQVQD